MSSTISNTVTTVLTARGQGSYVTFAQPVVEALINRELAISEELLHYAGDAGADVHSVRDMLLELGMAVPSESVPEDEIDEDDPGIQAQMRSLHEITQRLDSLTAFARANGYRG